MESNNLLYLCEAYYQIYEPSEFEVAAEYFYEMGINENGIDTLIEELGVDELSDWVFDINEARAAKKRTGGKSYEEIKAEIDAKERAKAAKKASTTQAPTKKQQPPAQVQKTMAGRLGAALGGAVNRAKRDIELTKKTAQTIGKAINVGAEALNRASDTRLARQARVATKKGFKRQEKAMTAAGGALGRAAARVPAIRDTYRAGEKFGRAMRAEDYELIVDYLLDEGYAETTEAAKAIVNCMSEEWICGIVEEMLDEGRDDK